MAEIKNTFLKGKMNQDLDSRILPNGEYREARNLSISRSESSTVGEFENVLGNTAISSLTAIGASATTEIIGQLIDENSNVAYFLATDYDSPTEVRATAADNCYIVKVDLSAGNAVIETLQSVLISEDSDEIGLFCTNQLDKIKDCNYYIVTVDEGEDVVNANLSVTSNSIVGVGNGFITEYSLDASVGSIPTASITI